MAYFLKKTCRKNDVYLQIYESHRDPVKKYAVHSSMEVLGYVKDLISQGINDPYEYAQEKVDDMNRELHESIKAKKVQKIGVVKEFDAGVSRVLCEGRYISGFRQSDPVDAYKLSLMPVPVFIFFPYLVYRDPVPGIVFPVDYKQIAGVCVESVRPLARRRQLGVIL